MTEKETLQARAKELGLSTDGTIAELQDRIAKAEADAAAGTAGQTPDAEPRTDGEDGVASLAENADLEHTRGGVTTRDDLHDQGVPMLAGSPAEPTGPEDALGVGEKRGDYRDRIVGHPHESRPLAGGGEPVTRWVDRDTGAEAKEGAKNAVEVRVDYAPTSTIVAQAPRAETIGDAEALKGGVETDPLAPGTAAGRVAASS
jgi:hypothetical protein